MDKPNALERLIFAVSPGWAAKRARARIAARHYEAASAGRRTQGWKRSTADANSVASLALSKLRDHSRDLVRNNAWAQNAVRVIPRNVVGWGITPKPLGGTKKLNETVGAWMNSTACDAAGRLPFAGLLNLIARGTVESGEMLIRRRWRRPEDGLTIPMQFQVLEPDFIDTGKTVARGELGGPVINGIEFDQIGRRNGYWLFESHPGSALATSTASRFVRASEIIHVFNVERAGQERGFPWLASAIVSIKDFDEFEDAQILRQKIAAMFAAFVTDYDGEGAAAFPGATDPNTGTADLSLEPGTVMDLPPGKQIQTANPPTVTEDGFSTRTLRKIAAAIGITYEDLTGDYSQVNFSSARMSRLAHWANVYQWQYNMMIPQACAPMWDWIMQAAALAGLTRSVAAPGAEWTPQPMPLIEPDREARANMLAVRAGQKTPSQVIREMGLDPESFFDEYAADLAELDKRNIHLDVDVRRVSQAGLTQARPAGTGFNDEAKEAEAADSGGGSFGGGPADTQDEGSPSEETE